MTRDEWERRKAAHDMGVADLRQAYLDRGLSFHDADQRARREQETISDRAEKQARGK